jgi:hypothetical protein
MVAADIQTPRVDFHNSEILKRSNKTVFQARGNVTDGKRVYLRLYAHSLGMQQKGRELRQQIERSKIPVVPEVKRISRKKAEDLYSRLHEQSVTNKFRAEIAVAPLWREVNKNDVSIRTIDENSANKLYDRLYTTQKQDSARIQDHKIQDDTTFSTRTIDENSAKQLYDRLYTYTPSETQKQDNLKIQDQPEEKTVKTEKPLVIDAREAQQLFDRLYNEKMGKPKR